MAPEFHWWYLNQRHGDESPGVNEICEWLKGDWGNYIDILATKAFYEPDLRQALTLANIEIYENFDQHVRHLFGVAPQPEYSTEIDPPDEIFGKRPVQWGRFGLDQINALSMEQVIQYLYAARKEIAYMKHEVSRLGRYLGVNNNLREQAHQNNFTYVPTKRRNDHVVAYSSGHGLGVEQSGSTDNIEASTIRLPESEFSGLEEGEILEQKNVDPQLKNQVGAGTVNATHGTYVGPGQGSSSNTGVRMRDVEL